MIFSKSKHQTARVILVRIVLSLTNGVHGVSAQSHVAVEVEHERERVVNHVIMLIHKIYSKLEIVAWMNALQVLKRYTQAQTYCFLD